MRRIKGFLVGLLGIVVALGLLELMAPSAKGLTFGFLSLLWTQFKAFFLSDIILTIVLFVLLAAGLFGTLYLSRKKEAKVWSIASAVVSLASAVGLFMRAGKH